jgi:hypothetical protein
MDLGFSGPKYTWNNRQQGLNNVMVRLDRALTKGQFVQHFEYAHVENIITSSSDHYDALLSLDNANVRRQKEVVNAGITGYHLFCTLCRRNLEMGCHLFQECPYARQIWVEMSNWVPVPSFHPATWKTGQGMQEWFADLSGASSLNTTKRKGAHASSLVCELKNEALLWMRAGNKKLTGLVANTVSE